MTITYLSTKLEGAGDIETSIRNGKVFDPEWPEPVGPTPEATKAILQAEYGLMVSFEPTRATPVARWRNEDLNFSNVVAYYKGTSNGDPSGGSGAGRKPECWHCGE